MNTGTIMQMFFDRYLNLGIVTARNILTWLLILNGHKHLTLPDR